MFRKIHGPMAVLLLYLAAAAAEVTHSVIVWRQHAFLTSEWSTWLLFAQKHVLGIAPPMVGVAVLMGFGRVGRGLAIAGFGAWAWGVLADAAIFAFGNTHFEMQHLDFAAPEGISGFLPELGLVLGVAGISLGLGGWTLWHAKVRWWPVAVVSGLLAVVAWLLPLQDQFLNNARRPAQYDKVTFGFRNEQLRYALKNPWRNLFDEWRRPKPESVVQVQRQVALDDTRRALGLGVGERRYPSLGLKPFNRVVLITVESLSAGFIGALNAQLGADPTPYFLSRPEHAERTFANYLTSASPTLPALLVSYFSHPNPEVPKGSGFRGGLPALLRELGFHTLFLRSASKYFADENLIFARAGFDETIAREDFFADPTLRPQITGWGLPDRHLYTALLQLLERRTEPKLFISVLGADTHPPAGRGRVGTLKYPEFPRVFGELWGDNPARYLTSIYHADFDLAEFWRLVNEHHLLTPETLIVITADHACPQSAFISSLPGVGGVQLGPIPLLFLSGQALPAVDVMRAGSQVDLAPTLMHLLGQPVPAAWWGESMLAPEKHNPVVQLERGTLRLWRERDELRVPLERKVPGEPALHAQVRRLATTLELDPANPP